MPVVTWFIGCVDTWFCTDLEKPLHERSNPLGTGDTDAAAREDYHRQAATYLILNQ